MTNRDDLKKKFKNGQCPDELAYFEVFDSTINLKDDCITPPSKEGNPLHITTKESNTAALRITGNLYMMDHLGQIPMITGDNGKGLRITAQPEPGKNIGPRIILRPNDYISDKEQGRIYLLIGDENKIETDIPSSSCISFQLRFNNTTDPSKPYRELLRIEKDKVIVAPSGSNVGIGTNSPTSRLHIVNSTNNSSFRVDKVSDGSPHFIIDKDGNVGIGENNPNGKLVVSGDMSGGGMLLAYLFQETAYKDGNQMISQYLFKYQGPINGNFIQMISTKVFIPKGTSKIAGIIEYEGLINKNIFLFSIKIDGTVVSNSFPNPESQYFVYSREMEFALGTPQSGLHECSVLFAAYTDSTLNGYIKLRRFILYIKN